MSKSMALLRARVVFLNYVNRARPGLAFCQSSSSAQPSAPPPHASNKFSPSASVVTQIEVNALLKKEPDRLNEAFKQVSTMSELSEMVRRENKSIGEANVVTALKKYATIRGESSVSDVDGLEQRDLSILCDRLIRCSWKLEPGAVVAALHSLVRLNLSSKTVVVQTLLQLLRRNVNQLTLSQVLRLSYILTRVEATALVEALRIALPLVFRNELRVQTDITDTRQLAELFHYACQHGTAEGELTSLADALINNLQLNAGSEWRAKDAEYILWGLASTKHELSRFQNLADQAAEFLTSHLMELSRTVSDRSSLLLLVQRLLGKNYSNERLLGAIVHLLLTEDWSFEHTHRVGRLLVSSSFPIPVAFLSRYVAAAESQLTNDPDAVPVSHVLDFCAGAVVRVPEMDSLANKLAQLVVSRPEAAWPTDPHAALQLALNLELNRCSSSQILPHLDIAGLLTEVTRTGDLPTTLCDCLLVQALAKVSAWEELLTDTLRTNLVPYAAWSSQNKIDFSLGSALNVWFSDRYNVHNAYITKTGIFVDHLLIEKIGNVQSEGCGESGLFSYPNQSGFVEDQILPTCDAKPLAVIANAGPSSRDWIRKLILEQAGFVVMEIPLISWKSLLEHERRPYLDRSLHEALGIWPLT